MRAPGSDRRQAVGGAAGQGLTNGVRPIGGGRPGSQNRPSRSVDDLDAGLVHLGVPSDLGQQRLVVGVDMDRVREIGVPRRVVPELEQQLLGPPACVGVSQRDGEQKHYSPDERYQHGEQPAPHPLPFCSPAAVPSW